MSDFEPENPEYSAHAGNQGGTGEACEQTDIAPVGNLVQKKLYLLILILLKL